jgi:WD40 repeat protein
MTPPWPNKSFNNLGHSVPHVAFSPSGSQLAFCVNNDNTGQAVVHIWDRWGNETLLEGHTESMHCLEYSLDGEHLASGSEDGSIRIWHTESFHPTASHPHMERATKTPRQVDTILGGSITSKIIALSFSRTDTNALASGGSNGEIKVWNVNEQACIHSFHPGRDRIRSLFFAGGAESTCIALTHAMSVIRLWKAEGRPLLAKRTIVGKADRGGNALGAALSPTGSFVAASFFSRTGNGNESTLALYDLETMTKTQSVVMPGFTATHIAVSPDSKQVVVGDDEGRIRILQTDDFSIQRDMDTTGEAKAVCSVAFDPTCRVLAFGYSDGGLELRRI